jgi:hypothetical protein
MHASQFQAVLLPCADAPHVVVTESGCDVRDALLRGASWLAECNMLLPVFVTESSQYTEMNM